jgi:hypothetical protein
VLLNRRGHRARESAVGEQLHVGGIGPVYSHNPPRVVGEEVASDDRPAGSAVAKIRRVARPAIGRHFSGDSVGESPLSVEPIELGDAVGVFGVLPDSVSVRRSPATVPGRSGADDTPKLDFPRGAVGESRPNRDASTRAVRPAVIALPLFRHSEDFDFRHGSFSFASLDRPRYTIILYDRLA